MVASPMPRWQPSSQLDQYITAYIFGGGLSVAATISR